MSPHPQQAALAASLADPETFWAEPAKQLHWHRQPSRALTRRTKTLASGVQHEHWSWFADGEISTSYNCVDRHVHAGRGGDVAIIWESPVTKTVEKYTYAQLLDEVEVLAGVLREEGVRKGDVVIIYSMFSLSLLSSIVVCEAGRMDMVSPHLSYSASLSSSFSSSSAQIS
jgi:propionyl-CoA synthetase